MAVALQITGDIVCDNILNTKSGVVAFATFSGNPKKATVTFSTAFANANYSVSLIGGDGDVLDYESLAAGSFIINTNSNPAPTVDVRWTAIEHNDP